MKVWSWRQAVQRSNLSSTTKLVLLNLGIYMNDHGESCYPTTRQQATDTGLSERSVCTHIDLAVTAGFLQKTLHGFSKQKWARNEYTATMPPEVEIGKEPPPAAPEQKALNDDQCLAVEEGSEGQKALNLVQEGTEPDDKKALKDVQCNSPLNSPSNSSAESDQLPLTGEDGPAPPVRRLALDDQLWFHGETIRLTKADYFRLRSLSGREDEAFWHWLIDRDRWYELQPPQARRRWFIPTQVAVKKLAGQRGKEDENGIKKTG